MSDPLSVAASIAGLIALAGELYISLDEFISNVRDAPSLAQTIQSEIKSFRNSLNALHRVLQDPAFGRSKRAALISADYVVVSFTDAVLVFSQLETNVLPLTKFTDYGVVARTQWTRKKVKLNELVGRLQWQKHTLVLQLNILRW
jgi:cell division control protein 24